ncbi:MAG: hypothetical protein ACI96M_003710, partial [Candidatus Azotimanducaceae bacterium]
TIEYAAHKGIGALGFQFASPEGATAWVNKYYNIISSDRVEKLAEYETNPNIAVVSGFMCAKTDEEARAKADGWTFFIFCLEYNGTHDYAPGTVNLWEEYQTWRSTEKAQKAFETGLIGSPDTIREKLKAFEASNIDQIILLNQSGKTSHQDICESLTLFSEEVMPEFQAREPEHQAWKAAVMAGEIQLEDIDVQAHKKLAVTDVINAQGSRRPSQEQIREIARKKAEQES